MVAFRWKSSLMVLKAWRSDVGRDVIERILVEGGSAALRRAL